jgi:putative Holliday junction resolvase
MRGRILAIDVGARRVGLAISDASRTHARPLETIIVTCEADAVERVALRIEQLDGEDEGIATIVVGLRRGSTGRRRSTTRVHAFIALLKTRTTMPVATEDER